MPTISVSFGFLIIPIETYPFILAVSKCKRLKCHGMENIRLYINDTGETIPRPRGCRGACCQAHRLEKHRHQSKSL